MHHHKLAKWHLRPTIVGNNLAPLGCLPTSPTCNLPVFGAHGPEEPFLSWWFFSREKKGVKVVKLTFWPMCPIAGKMILQGFSFYSLDEQNSCAFYVGFFIKYFVFSPLFSTRFPIWRAYFSDGLVVFNHQLVSTSPPSWMEQQWPGTVNSPLEACCVGQEPGSLATSPPGFLSSRRRAASNDGWGRPEAQMSQRNDEFVIMDQVSYQEIEGWSIIFPSFFISLSISSFA